MFAIYSRKAVRKTESIWRRRWQDVSEQSGRLFSETDQHEYNVCETGDSGIYMTVWHI